MKTGQERQAWLDYVRFFSIFLVIVFHTPPRLALFDDAVILNLRQLAILPDGNKKAVVTDSSNGQVISTDTYESLRH